MIVYVGSLKNDYIDGLVPLIDTFPKKFINYENPESLNLIKCPAVTNELACTFTVKSTVDYELVWDGKNEIYTEMYSKKFFDSNVAVKDVKTGLVSFNTPHLHFFSEFSLEMSVMHPVYENNSFADNTRVITGTYDIGKHLRVAETSFFFKQPGKLTIKSQDIISYVKFHTKEKIEIRPFLMSPELIDLLHSFQYLKKFSRKFKPLDWWYKRTEETKRNKIYLDLIKKNLL